jgi:hypothetical protein
VACKRLRNVSASKKRFHTFGIKFTHSHRSGREIRRQCEACYKQACHKHSNARDLLRVVTQPILSCASEVFSGSFGFPSFTINLNLQTLVVMLVYHEPRVNWAIISHITQNQLVYLKNNIQYFSYPNKFRKMIN